MEDGFMKKRFMKENFMKENFMKERFMEFMDKKRIALMILFFIILQTILVIPSQAASSKEKDPAIAILFTNDVHCYYDRDIGYDGLMLYKKELEQQYEHVILLDAGDAVQGAPIGSLSQGSEITYNTILDVLPYSSNVLIGELKGQTILDALEYGCKDMPVTKAIFPQVSGLEFTVDLNITSTVETNEAEDFVKVAGERRVSNVLVNGEPLDLEKTYTITTLDFLFIGGDHYTMLKNDAKNTGTTQMTDNALLAEYIEKNLNGVIPERYRQAEGRIHVIN